MLETQEEDEIRGEDDDDLLELGSEVEEEEYNYEEDEDAANKYDEAQQHAEGGDGRGSNPAVHNECCMHLDIGGKHHALTSQRSDDVLGLIQEAATAKGSTLISQLRSQDAEKPEHDSRGEDACVPDAICTRTRAHYSLADMSLDQLETFLQEPDEEEYLPNVNDQEEYQKFLAAVLEEGAAPDSSNSKQDPIIEEEDDDDGDFEAEIEGALESDREGQAERGLDKLGRQRHKIVTRGKRRQRSQGQDKERLGCVGTGRLRPLIPNAQSSTVRKPLEKTATGEAGNGHAPATRRKIPVNGFTAHQIGQLHSLIHEHVQLLIQVFALSILEPSRQQIAIDTHKMLVEMAERRSAILSWKKSAFPDFCFRPPYIHPSVTQDFLCHSGSSSICDIVEWLQGEVENSDQDHDCGSSSHQAVNAVQLRDSHSFTGNIGKTFPCVSGTVAPCHSATQWASSSSQPVRSLMDVAPLSRVQEFLANIATVVQHYMQRHVESGSYHSECEREPLFPPPKAMQSQANPGSRNHDGSVVASLKTYGKRTMAAALVENTKKQSIALVPKGVVSAIQIFLPLFNPALFPHKAPPPATANRLLFTDAEDELLAMGLMTYNTDWKAIQQRFLPSKTVHQIFVRQKNMSSSRAPENPIKAVRRIKSSALTVTERDFIYKALKLKYNWAKVWQYCVPYRDPAILPRQWRIAQGIQKSYKMNSLCKEKHRLYEASRRRAMSYNKIVCLTPKGVTENRGLTEDASYPLRDERHLVKDAFLADWKPYSFQAIAAATAASPNKEQSRARLRRKRMKAHALEQLNGEPLQGTWRQTPEISTVPFLPFYADAWPDSCPPSAQPGGYPQKKLAVRTVKLSPDLPPVNLPPRVHAVSQPTLHSPEGRLSSRGHSNKKDGRLDAHD